MEQDEISRIDRVFNIQKENRWEMTKSSAETRKLKLKALLKSIESNRSNLQHAMRLDFRKPEQEVDLTEIMPVIHEIKMIQKNLKQWMKPVKVSTPVMFIGGTSRIVYESRGQCLIIGPWNYPFMLVMGPLVSAVAAGNCIMIKPSEYTENVNQVIRKILLSVFSENEVAIIEGDKDISQYLLEKPFDHIFFTGSTTVGKKIMEAASKNLSTVTLELGGKSPVIIDRTIDLKKDMPMVLWGKFLNGGQTCVGVDYALVHKNMQNNFIFYAKQVLKTFYGQEEYKWKSTPDFCRIINDRNFNRIKKAVDDTIKMGAKIEIGGKFDLRELYISPTILSGVPLDSPIMHEEIFGPILPVLTYDSIPEAIETINSREKPLALYIFSHDNHTIKQILSNTSSGGVMINGVIVHLTNPNLPFGGVNHSGIGNYHGYFGFKEFSHERAVFYMPKLHLLKYLFPPYNAISKKMIEMTTKYF